MLAAAVGAARNELVVMDLLAGEEENAEFRGRGSLGRNVCVLEKLVGG